MIVRGKGIGLHVITKDEVITLVVPSKGYPRYKFASMIEYCKNNNKEISELTAEEKSKFIIKEEG